MTPRRAALALFVLSLLAASLPLGMASARAQTVEEAEQQADQAATARDDAYAVVAASVANRDAIEAELFAALNRYDQAVAALAAANRKLDRVGRTLATAEASSVDVEEELRTQAVAAYMEAVLQPGSIVVGTDTAEEAMVVGQVFTEGQSDSLSQLDLLTVQRADLERLRTDFDQELADVEELRAQLEEEAANLTDLFAQADADVAEAYQRASAADQAYRAALSDVEKARSANETPPTTPETTPTTTPGSPTTTAPGVTTTTPETTTTTEPSGARPAIRPEAERWRSLASQFFRSGLVDDALLIIQCESNGDPNAVNPYSGASGLFQFIPGTWAVASVGAGYPDASVFDPEANIAAAAWLSGYYEANGSDPWAPWACRYYLG
jgi:hypothetical protein